MAVEVGGSDQGPLRSKWVKGRWVQTVDRRNSFTISVDSGIAPEVQSQRHLVEEDDSTFKSGNQPKKAVCSMQQWGQLDGPVNSSSGSTTVMTEVTTGTTCTRRYTRKSEGADGQHMMIPLYSMTTTAPVPPGNNTKVRKSSERRAKIFQRAYSCDVDQHLEGSVDRPSRTCRSQELEMTCVEVDQLVGGDVFDASKTTDALLLLESHSSPLEGATIASGELKDSERDAGIVCSDEDLHSILSEISHTRRTSAEVKREKMKSNRSLSLDSSFFKLHMKRLQADSPTWLARILNQRDRKESTAATTATVSPECGSGDVAGDMLLLRKRSVSCKKPDSTPATISEDTVSVEGDLSSRRESTVSGSDDECSLLLVNNSESVVQGNANPSVNVAAADNRTMQASRVVWNESSVVDAEVLGHAIEFYLTSATGKRPSIDACECNCQTGIIANSPGGEACVPVMSSLKSLFV